MDKSIDSLDPSTNGMLKLLEETEAKAKKQKLRDLVPEKYGQRGRA